ncbi:MAG: SWIM zinc finger family protein [Kiritimatiellae bacterium]|nr:SWIM zinc finger family protein [Kiritimatiellia bacterium]
MSKKRYAPRIPRSANGFRAQCLKNIPRGAWWSKGWLRAIEEMRIGARAGRGKAYAEQGQVISLKVSASHVEASVLGGRPDPYIVKLDFLPVPANVGDGDGDIVRQIGEMTFGRILAGEMPISIDEFFSVRSMSLYPALGKDHFWCSCPDWSKPCKHIAAVLYLLGDAMVRDPALLLRLRGIELPEVSPTADSGLPLWRGSEKLDDFISQINRRVYGRR